MLMPGIFAPLPVFRVVVAPVNHLFGKPLEEILKQEFVLKTI